MCSLKTTDIFWIQNAVVSQEALHRCITQRQLPHFVPSVHSLYPTGERFNVRQKYLLGASAAGRRTRASYSVDLVPPSQLPCRGLVEGTSGTPGPSGISQAASPMSLFLVNRIKHEQEGCPPSKQLLSETICFSKNVSQDGGQWFCCFAGGRKAQHSAGLGESRGGRGLQGGFAISSVCAGVDGIRLGREQEGVSSWGSRAWTEPQGSCGPH